MTTLTATANVKSWLGVDQGADDALLTRLITSASAMIETWLNRKIEIDTYTETRSGNGKARLMLGNWPVTMVRALKINGVSIPASTGFDVSGYVIEERSILLRGYIFRPGVANIEIEYDAGYDDVPADIEQACIELVALRYRERDRIGHSSKSLQGETVSFTITDFPVQVKTLLNNYKRVIPL